MDFRGQRLSVTHKNSGTEGVLPKPSAASVLVPAVSTSYPLPLQEASNTSSCVADRVLVLWLRVNPELPRWQSQVQDIGPPATSWLHVISNGESSPRDLHLKAFNNQQATVLDTLCQTTSKTGTQPHPRAQRLPKIIIRSQTPQNTPQDSVLPTRRARSSLIHQNTGTSPLHQEAYTTH